MAVGVGTNTMTSFGSLSAWIVQIAMAKVENTSALSGRKGSMGYIDQLTVRNSLLAELEDAHKIGKKADEDARTGQLYAFDFDEEPQVEFVPFTGTEEEASHIVLGWERELLGVYISGHPLDVYAKWIDGSFSTVAECIESDGEIDRDDEYVTFCGLVTLAEKRVSKKGKPYAMLMIEDRTSPVKVLCFNRCFDEGLPFFHQGKRVVVEGVLKGEQKFSGEETSYIVFGSEITSLDEYVADLQEQADEFSAEVPVMIAARRKRL
jgi:DNA polymerase III alpha subunit